MSQLRLTYRRVPPPGDEGEGDGPRVWTVSDVVRTAGRVLEQRIGMVWVEGEITDLTLAARGHAYFALTDGACLLPAVMWRSAVARLRLRLEEGQRVRLYGRPGVYDQRGRFQFYAERAVPAGEGARMAALQELRRRLEAEGLLAPERKRPLPRQPRRVGVVTSASGAALHDIIEVARRRCPTRILLAPAAVQGEGAPAQLRAALARLQRVPDVDVIILGRGGGSADDLWAFNDEALARAVAACPVPVVSAVGHEVDVTACDWVADVRAATPSQAAEIVVPDAGAWAERLRDLDARLARSVRRLVGDRGTHLALLTPRLAAVGRRLGGAERERLARLSARLSAVHPRAQLSAHRRRHQQLAGRVAAWARALPGPRRERLARLAGAVDALSPLGVLARGYAIALDDDGRAVRDAAELTVGQDLDLRLHRGRARVRVTAAEPEPDGA